MDVEDAGRRGGFATAALMSAAERKAKAMKMVRAKRLKARKKGRIAAASRKANRA
jgi:hypothetical protein